MIESKTTNDIIESRQSQGLDSGSVWSRSGVSGDSLSTSDTNLPQANCNKMIESIILLQELRSCISGFVVEAPTAILPKPKIALQ
ncbi:hypothetical protein [uncultured Helicobacter sp.]|uniref:hypothetical protein n=1 Tax=uncultured Helicobacter sp. TaxID=175537 RepID=UPI00374EA5A7